MQYDDVITNPRWWINAILKIVFWLYLGVILADQREIWNRDEGSHASLGNVTRTAIFVNSRWRTAAILKIALSQCSTAVRTVVRATQQVNGKWPFSGCQNSVTPEPID